MQNRFDNSSIRRRYSANYDEAVHTGKKLLSYYDIEDWLPALNTVETRIYSDLRATGLQLYPIQ